MAFFDVGVNSFIMLPISIFASHISIAQYFSKISKVGYTGVRYLEITKMIMGYFANFIVIISIVSTILLTFTIVETFPNKIESIANGATFLSLAFVFMMIAIFED